jgi:NSS family neurotransmitter:Na+ symporter
LPIGGLVICALVGIKRWAMMKDEIRMGSGVSESMMSVFRGILTVGCPLLIIVVLISGLMPS